MKEKKIFVGKIHVHSYKILLWENVKRWLHGRMIKL